jgi:hypothetical protein
MEKPFMLIYFLYLLLVPLFAWYATESRLEGGEYGETEIYEVTHNYKPG